MRETAAAAVRSPPTAVPPLHRDVRRAATAKKKKPVALEIRVFRQFFFYFSFDLVFFFLFYTQVIFGRPTRARKLRNDGRPHQMFCEFISIARAPVLFYARYKYTCMYARTRILFPFTKLVAAHNTAVCTLLITVVVIVGYDVRCYAFCQWPTQK